MTHCSLESDSSSTPRVGGLLVFSRLFLIGGLLAAFLMGGPLVKAAAVASGLFAFFGDRDGAVRNFIRLGGFLLAVWAAPRYGPGFGQSLGTQFPSIASSGWLLGVSLVFCGVNLAAHILASLVRRAARRSVGVATLDRALGGLLGAVEGATLIVACCWALGALQPTIQNARLQAATSHDSQAPLIFDALAKAQDFVASDPAGRALSSVNPLPDVPALRSIQQLSSITTDRKAVQAMLDDRRMRDFIDLPVVQKHVEAIRQSPELRAALDRRDFGAVLQSSAFQHMLADGELYGAITSHWDDLQAAIAAASNGAHAP